MKKIVVFVLCILLSFSLYGCKSTDDLTRKNDKDVSESVIQNDSNVDSNESDNVQEQISEDSTDKSISNNPVMAVVKADSKDTDKDKKENTSKKNSVQNDTKDKKTNTKTVVDKTVSDTETKSYSQSEEGEEKQKESQAESPTESPTETCSETPSEDTPETTEAATEPKTETPTEEPTEAPPQSTSVSYSPGNVVALATSKCQSGGMITTTDNLANLLAEGKITEDEYNEYYPYDGLGYYSVFVETDLNSASTTSGRKLGSEQGIADYIADMLLLEREPYFLIEYAGESSGFYEFRCYR